MSTRAAGCLGLTGLALLVLGVDLGLGEGGMERVAAYPQTGRAGTDGMWDASRVPFVPELFSGPALAQFYDKAERDELQAVPYFEGLMAGEPEALVKSFAAEPELYDPIRGRVKGRRAFEAFVSDMNAWIARRNVTVENVQHVVSRGSGFEEVILHLDGDSGRIDLPFAMVADREPDGHIDELRIYFSTWALTGRHTRRPPLLQPDPELAAPGLVADYLRALGTGELDAVLATFERDGSVREPAGGQYLHSGPDDVRAFYAQWFSHGGAVPLEPCALTADQHACALEYNVVRWGHTELTPQAGLAVFVPGQSGKLAAVRIYDDVDPSATAR
ncbi:MAG TPA: nuclear transport factor 2 family protein [Solirubrobacteraceae bacterium]|nr:nuclear transport factor 2 family protein [Solirubrobacteraceae bacterium]